MAFSYTVCNVANMVNKWCKHELYRRNNENCFHQLRYIVLGR